MVQASVATAAAELGSIRSATWIMGLLVGPCPTPMFVSPVAALGRLFWWDMSKEFNPYCGATARRAVPRCHVRAEEAHGGA